MRAADFLALSPPGSTLAKTADVLPQHGDELHELALGSTSTFSSLVLSSIPSTLWRTSLLARPKTPHVRPFHSTEMPSSSRQSLLLDQLVTAHLLGGYCYLPHQSGSGIALFLEYIRGWCHACHSIPVCS
jgi:hypothetical protein